VDAVFDRWLDGEASAALPGAETGAELVARFAGALEGIADRHRGETVVVVSHGGVMTLALPAMAGRSAKALAAAAPLDNAAVVEVEGDADGWRIVCWPGEG
jgi:probable phosphoglycerate mutase